MKSAYDPIEEEDRDRPDKRAEWMQRGREAPAGQSAAALRLRAHQQKMAMRAQRAAAAATGKTGAASAGTAGTSWVALGPAPLMSDRNFFGVVSGRSTAVAIDPSDATGNTVYVAGAYGGVWKSTNAANAVLANVTWTAVTDQQASLANGAASVKSDGSVVLVGTGEPNSAIDSYYGVGILRSLDHGNTWTLIPSADSGAHPFAGLGFSKFAWLPNTNTVVAATATTAKGFDEGNITASTNRGLYLSTDNGVSWTYQAPKDGSTTITPISATDVVYDATAGQFIASVRSHGLYRSTNGTTWTRMTNQPTPLSTANCPAVAAPTCPMYRGQLAVVPGRDEVYFWFINIDQSNNIIDEGIWRSINGAAWSRIDETGLTNCGDPLGCGVDQAFYNLEIAAVADGSDTDIYAGAVNLFKCELASAATTCSTVDANLPNSWLNLTHVYGSCGSSIASVHPDEHGIDFKIVGGKDIMYFGNDGGIYRTLDGFMGLNIGSCNTGGSNQFDNLNATIGSMTQFVSFSIHPTDRDTVLGGTQDNGSPASSTATSSSQFFTANGGDGGYNAINPNSTSQWFTANTDISVQVCNSGISCSTNTFSPVVTAATATVGGDYGPFYTPYILDPQNSAELLLGSCRVWRGSTAGTNFSTLSVNFDVGSATTCTGNETNLVRGLAAGGPKDGNGSSNVVYATTEGTGPNCTAANGCNGPQGGEVWVTTNAATTAMSNVTGNTINPSHYTISSVVLDGSDSSGKTAYLGIMGFGGSHIWKTTNAGGTWTDWTGTGLPNAPVNALLVDSQTQQVYAGTDVGVFVSSISSAAWVEVGPAPGTGVVGYLPNVPVSAIRLFNSGGLKRLRVSTYGRGIWEYNLSPDYTNVISDSPQTVFPTQTATFNGTLTAQNGYNSPVNLSCTGTPPTTCTLNPTQQTPTTGGAAYTMTAGGAVGDYNFNAHGVGTDANTITHNAAATLHVVDFALTAPNPNTLSVAQGGTSNESTFVASASGSFSGVVTLSCPTGLPTGAACVFSPSATVQPTSAVPVTVTLTVRATANTPVGNSTVTLSAATTGAPAAKTQTFTLQVTAPAPDFTIAVTATPNTTALNQNVVWNGTLTANNGYNKSVNLSCTAGAPGTCTLTPPSLTPAAGGAGFTVTAGSATSGTFNFTIQGTDGTLTHATPTETLTVGSDFSVPATLTDATVEPGQTASTSMAVTPVGASTFSDNVTYACSGLPAGLSCVFNPTQINVGGAATNVGISISTAGPFTGTQGRLLGQWTGRAAHGLDGRGRPAAHEQRLWLALGLPLAGMGLVGLARRGRPRRYSMVGLCGAVVLGGFMVACGGSLASGPPPPPPVSVTVSPSTTVQLWPNLAGFPATGTTKQFSATVNNASNQAVTWAVVGGNTNGTIDATGLYTAPVTVPNPTTVTITAASQADTTKSGTGHVNIQTPTGASVSTVTVTVTEATVQHTATFTLTVQ